MKKRPIDIQEAIDNRLAEYAREFEKKHTAWVVVKNGHTYVGFDVHDNITEPLMCLLRKLMELMDIKASIKYPWGDDEEYYFIIEGEDKTKAEYINKFIDNGYKLIWE